MLSFERTDSIASSHVYLAPLRTFSKTLKKGAVCHHLYLTLTRLPFTVTCLNVLSAWNTDYQHGD